MKSSHNCLLYLEGVTLSTEGIGASRGLKTPKQDKTHSHNLKPILQPHAVHSDSLFHTHSSFLSRSHVSIPDTCLTDEAGVMTELRSGLASLSDGENTVATQIMKINPQQQLVTYWKCQLRLSSSGSD